MSSAVPAPFQVTTTTLRSLVSLRGLSPLISGFAIGTTLWHSFLAGPIQYYNLPRQQFGNLQSKQFPAFFAVQAGSALSLLGIWLSSRTLPKIFSLRDPVAFNASLLALALASAVANLGYAGPVATEIMRTRHRVEKLEGTTYDAPTKSPRMISLNKRFAVAHSVSSVLNLVTLGALMISGAFVGVHA